MSSYYCLMAGLPDVSLDDSKGARSVAGFKDDLDGILSAKDKELLSYFYMKFDCQNLVALLKNPESEKNPNGNYTLEELQDLMVSVQETETDVRHFPDFMPLFVREFSHNRDKKGFFPEDALALEYYRHAMKCPNRMMAEWYRLNFDMTNILTALIARKQGWNVSDYILGDNTVCEMIRENNSKDFGLSYDYDYVAELMKIVECEDPVEKEKRLDVFKWMWLEDRTFFDPFSIEAVFAYMCKLEMLERWERLDVETGRETFRQIIDNLRGEARVPEEFKK